MLLALAGAAQAQSVLVSNIDQSILSANFANLTAQGFTTGSHSNGYDLSSIILFGAGFSSSNGNTATLHEGSRTGTKVADFTSAVNSDGTRITLTPSRAVVLDASTEFWVVTANDFGNAFWNATASDNEAAGDGTGWNIADDAEIFQAGSNSWETITSSFLLSVSGSLIPDVTAPPPPTGPTPPTGPAPPAGGQYYSPATLVASLSDDGASIRVDWTRPGAEHIARTDHFLTWARSGHITDNNFILGPDTLVAQVDKSQNGTTVEGLPVGEPYTFFVKSVYTDGGQASASRIALPALTASGPADTTSVLSAEGEEIPGAVRLDQNYPNPFNPRTTIRYALPQAGDVRLVAYDMLGHEVAVLADGPQAAGMHTVRFDASGLPNGTYAYRLAAGGKTITRAMVLVK